jgi:hypothetical protein
MRLTGRTQADPARRERKMAKRPRDAPALPHHGPLQPMVRRRTGRSRTVARYRLEGAAALQQPWDCWIGGHFTDP